jgi:hypothetical protein
MPQEMQLPTLLSSSPDAFANMKYPARALLLMRANMNYLARDAFANTKYPTCLSSHSDGDTGVTSIEIRDAEVTGAMKDKDETWGNQLLRDTMTTAGTSKTADASCGRQRIVSPDDVRRVLRMNDLVHAVKKAWDPKRHHRNQKPMLLEEVPSPTSCKHEPDTLTCWSLSGMQKLFSALKLPWGTSLHYPSQRRICKDELKSSQEDSAVPSVALLKLSAADLHMLEVIEQATGKPWYRESYSCFPKPKAHVAKKCATMWSRPLHAMSLSSTRSPFFAMSLPPASKRGLLSTNMLLLDL